MFLDIILNFSYIDTSNQIYYCLFSMKVDYIALSVPVFFILIGIELAYNFYKKFNYYRLNDSISNLS